MQVESTATYGYMTYTTFTLQCKLRESAIFKVVNLFSLDVVVTGGFHGFSEADLGKAFQASRIGMSDAQPTANIDQNVWWSF